MGLSGGKLSLAVAAVLLALSMASCGGDDDSTASDSTSAAQAQGSTGSQGDSTQKQQGKPKKGGGSDGSQGSGPGGSSKQHNDSGGGSAQFKVKGGDNSVQEFGQEGSKSEFDQAAEAVHGFFDARVKGDWQAACSYLAADVVESLKQLTGNSRELAGAGCAKTLATLSEGAPREAFVAAAEADVGSLRIEGGQAFVLYRGANGTVFVMPMKDEGGTWKVASLAGTPLN